MNTLTNMKKTLISGSAFALLLHAASSYAALDVSQQPLMLVDSVAPNLVFTLDDSGSMRWAYVPDAMGNNNNPVRNTRRVKSAFYNPMYYNPEIEYLAPIQLDSNGNRLGTFTTSFTQARHNGFKSNLGTRDLRTGYRVSWNDNINVAQNYNYSSVTNYAAPTGTIPNLAENPEVDFITPTANLSSNGSTATRVTPSGISMSLRRGSSGSCTVTSTTPSIPDAVCIRVSGTNNYYGSATRSAVPAYYYVYNPDNSGCNNDRENDACYTLRLVTNNSGPGGIDERQNFANWYSFYRNRALATLSAANLAFYELPSSIRFTWQSLGNCTTLNSANCNNNRFRTYSDRHKANFFQWMEDLNFDQSTPLRNSLRRAGEFLKTDIAWASNPNPFSGSTVTNPQLTCRPSYHILMTDGMWNGSFTAPTDTFRHDASSFTLPDGTAYNGERAPFADTTANTLADLAMHYWATDLRPGLANEIKPFTRFPNANPDTQYWDPRNNPATWQHMVNFTVGLALSNALNKAGLEWQGGTFEGQAYRNLRDGTIAWPPASPSDDNNVYDLWHAAINSRGEFFSADSPEELVNSFQEVLNRIAERTAIAGRPGVSASVSLDGDLANASIVNRIFETSYDSQGGWEGNIVRRDVVRQGDGTVRVNEVWSAAEKITAQRTSRNIFMAGGGSNGLQSFSWSNLTPAQQTLFNINPDGLGISNDGRGQARVNYVRGSDSNEGTQSNDFRPRRSIIGDIINSSPVIVGPATNIPYLMDRIDGNPGEYLDFVRASINRPELAYVGANDGMLHAIFTGDREDDNGQPVFTGGRQAFAFIPSAVIPNLPRLTGQNYVGGGHRFFVDGTPVVRDVYFDNAWRTVLIGTLRAGGKSVFALDITNPGLDGSGVKLLWEISNQDADFTDLGYSFARPEIARLHSGQWGVLLGNGYDSVDGKAVMYVIDIATGSRLAALEVDDGSDSPNGLSSVRGADNNSDGIVDYAYAGDLQGNLWRFDLVTTGNVTAPDPFASSVVGTLEPTSFAVSYGGSPLFTATASNGQPQAITGLPSLVRHPTRRGYLVIVGTGKYFETADASPDTSKANTVYAIWDRYTRGQSTSSSLAQADRRNLQIQSITQETTTSFGGVPSTVRVVSDNNIQWYQAGTTPADEDNESRVNRRGWALDLTVNNVLDGEMIVADMLARGGTLLFSTITPNDDPCADGLSSRLYGINAATGARLSRPPFDFSRDGRISGDDFLNVGGNLVPPSGIDLAIPGGIPLTRDGLICGNDGQCIEFIVPPEDQGRTSWQDMPTPEPDNDDDDDTDPADEG